MTAHSLRKLFPLLAATALAVAPSAHAAASDCGSCHQKLLSAKVRHNIECQECHRPQGPKGKCEGSAAGWTLAKPEVALCTRCHEKLFSGGAKPHKPARLGCTACHDPHGGDQKWWLKISPVDQLCYGKCHAPFKGAAIHTAVKEGNCTGCHDGHAGVASPLLVAPPARLCDKCHDKAKLGPSRVKHPPFGEGDCLSCHDSHKGADKRLLLAEGKALCARCHSTKAKPTPASPGPGFLIDFTAPKLHEPLVKGDCDQCHVRGHSGEEMLLKKPVPALCDDCHKPKPAPAYVHGAMKAGDCDGCHEPHGSGRDHLLREASASALCFRCHEDDVTGRASVHKPVAEGKCTECHGAHGGDNPFDLVRGAGKGGCTTDCHPGKGDAKVQHRELERHGCTGCHDPHGSNQPAELVKPVNALCTGCHAKEKDGLHVATSASVQGGHPVSGAFDPRRAGRSFSCASCHDPHGSANPKLYYFGANETEMCDWCHGDMSGKHPELKDIHKQRPAAPEQGDRR